MIIKRQKEFGNKENKAKRKAWEEKQALETYNKKIAYNGTNMAQWNNPVNPQLVEKGKFLKEGSEQAKAELRAIHRNNFKYGDIRNNVSPKVLEKHTDFGGMFHSRVDHLSAVVEDGENAYNRLMEQRSGKRRNQHESIRGIKKNGSSKPKAVVPELLKSQSSKKNIGSVLGGIRKRIGQGLRKLASK